MIITRRRMLALLAASAEAAYGRARRPVERGVDGAQGISSRGVTPQPRGKPSGRPFHARFTDVAAEAGLTHPVVYGGIDTKRYILEVVGCGVAFLDYDNDGFDDLFITYYGHHVLYHNNGDGTFTDVTAKAGLAQEAVRYGAGCRWVDYDRDGHLDLFVATYLDTTLEQLPRPGENPDCRWKAYPSTAGLAACLRDTSSCFTIMAMVRSPTSAGRPAWPPHPARIR